MDYNSKLLNFFKNPNGKASLNKRINSYTTEEPETIKWIESFSSDSNLVFYDIGSNIGGFSIIASLIHDDIQIYSFEPNFMNFYYQIKTCRDNNLSNIFPLNLAINNKNEFNFFKYDRLNVGSKGTFGEELKEQMLNSQYSNPFKRGISYEAGVLGVSLDSLVYEFNLKVPNYIKIDVDGTELLILKGAKKLLKDEKLREIYIEIDDEIYSNNEIEILMSDYDFEVKSDINVGSKHIRFSKEKFWPMRMVLYVRQ
jgi:FkbM family methyltransferase